MARKRGPEPGGWLFKEEPDHYSFADLERDGKTWWTGVENALARQHLRQVKAGDRVLYYHTGKERAIVGEMRVISGPRADSASTDPKAVMVEVQAVTSWPEPLSLATIKKDARLAAWDLVRLPRLSVMPVNAEQWNIVEKLARQEDG